MVQGTFQGAIMPHAKDVLFNRINTICLGVRDIVKARTFYRDGIGLATNNNEDNPPVVFFKNGGTRLELYPLDLLAKDISETNPPPTPGGFGGITLAYCAHSKDEADAIFARVEGIGGKIVKPPQNVFWGGYSGYFQDLDGYYWEVAYYDQWRFDDNGMIINLE